MLQETMRSEKVCNFFFFFFSKQLNYLFQSWYQQVDVTVSLRQQRADTPQRARSSLSLTQTSTLKSFSALRAESSACGAFYGTAETR